MRSAFQEPIRNDSNSMSASTRSREARQVLSRIFPWLRPRLQPSEQERLSSRNNRYYSPHRKIGGASGRTVGETGYLSVTMASQRATISPQADSLQGLITGLPIILQLASWGLRAYRYQSSTIR